jgi:PAS domain S-box-containing protein
MEDTGARTLLLVEDEAVIALVEKRKLESRGYAVQTVHSGEKAVQTVCEDPTIDLILMDIDLGPGIDGTEAAQKILSLVELPIVFLTSHTEKEYVDRVRGITSYGYVIKHSGEFVLTESIRMALELFEANQQAREREESLNEIINQAPVGIFESRFDGTLRFMNNELARILGFASADEALAYYNDLARQVYARPSRRTEFLQLLEHEGVVRGFELEARRVDGTPLFLRMNARLVSRRSEESPAISGFIVDETVRRETERQLAERIKELHCLYELGQLTAQTDTAPEVVLQGVVDLLPPSWQYPEIACARVVIDGMEVTSPDFDESPWSITADIRVRDESVGSVEVLYREERPQADEGPFLSEERHLIDAVAGRLARWIERTRATAQTRFQSQLLEAVDEAVIATDLSGSITYWNSAAEQLYGWEAREVLGKSIAEVTVPRMSQEQAAAIMDSVSAGGTWSGEFMVQDRAGRRFPARVSNSPVYEADGALSGIVGVSYDLTEQRQAAEKLERIRERHARAERAAHLGHWEMDIATANSVWSDEFFRICGYEPQSFSPTAQIGFSIIHPEDQDRAARHVTHTLETGEPYSVEKRIVRPDGAIRWVHSRGDVVYNQERQPVKLIGSFLDITERKRAERRLQAALEEKDRLMSELNHRVKNNLSMILSLMHLKQDALGDRADLSDIINRIGAIRVVHEKLQHSGSVDRVDLGSYVEDVLSSVFSLGSHTDVEIENTIDDVALPTNIATTLGLIVNELATNAAKHGFDSESDQRFSVDMAREEEPPEYVLTVANTGPAFPDDVDLENPASLGLQLVTALTRQLGGTLSLQRTPNPVFTIRFPVPE